MNAKAMQGQAIYFPVSVKYDDDAEPQLEWIVDARGRLLQPFEIVMFMNACAPVEQPSPQDDGGKK